MKQVLCILFIFFIGSFVSAQGYKTAVGFKGGYPGYGSISAKHYLNSINAIEANLGAGLNGLTVQGLYEWNHPLPTNGLNWYLGVGPNIGFLTNNSTIGSAFYLSGSGLIGIEYIFDNIPLDLALDAGPIVQVIPSFGLGWGGGIAVRYTLK